MKWFRLESWKDNSKIGYYPRVEEIIVNVDELPYFKHPETRIVPEKIIFNERSLFTDAIFENANLNGSMWIVSEKLKSILQSFILPAHEFYQIPKTIKGGLDVDFGYYLFVIFEEKDIDVNYDESKFRTVSYSTFLKKDTSMNMISISSHADYIKQRRIQSDLLKDIHPVLLVLNKPLNEDLFALRAAKYFVSEKLAAILDKEKVTGFDLVPIDFEVIEQRS